MHSSAFIRVQFSIPIVLLLFITAQIPRHVSLAKGSTIPIEKGKFMVEKMVPAKEMGKEIMFMLNDKRRKLGNFQICALCTCCARGVKGSYCLPTPCCYGINCNIPNRPFGFCSFTPKTCNCFGCHI